MTPEGVSYQYEFERFTTDERTQNIRLSSSLNDFRSARIPGSLFHHKIISVILWVEADLKFGCFI